MPKKLTKEDFIKRAKNIHKDKYDYSLVNYINNGTKIQIICKKHGEFFQKPTIHVAGHGCPKCNNYKGEIEIESWLIKNNVKYQTQKKFLKCKNKKGLKFDFYLPNYNLCIEYDGIQHFKPILIFGGKKEFIQREINDKIKNKFCEQNNIRILRITYKENIKNKLNKYFKNFL